MSIESRLRRIAEERLGRVVEGALPIAVAESPYDLGPLRDAIEPIKQNWEGNTLVSGLEWGMPQVSRQRGYYPGILNSGARGPHEDFIGDIGDSLRSRLPELMR